MNVIECIDKYVKGVDLREPIFTQDIFSFIAERVTDIRKDVVNEYITRYLDRNSNFVRFQKGIYYKTVETPFGKAGIDITALIRRIYLYDGDKVVGYETGPSYMNKMGLTTQMPKDIFIATKKARVKKLDGVRIVRAVTEISGENYRYLQLLDMMDNPFKVAIEGERTKAFRDFIDRYELSYETLLNYACLYRNKNIYQEIAKTTRRSV